jgi:hypothetical protein
MRSTNQAKNQAIPMQEIYYGDVQNLPLPWWAVENAEANSETAVRIDEIQAFRAVWHCIGDESLEITVSLKLKGGGAFELTLSVHGYAEFLKALKQFQKSVNLNFSRSKKQLA